MAGCPKARLGNLIWAWLGERASGFGGTKRAGEAESIRLFGVKAYVSSALSPDKSGQICPNLSRSVQICPESTGISLFSKKGIRLFASIFATTNEQTYTPLRRFHCSGPGAGSREDACGGKEGKGARGQDRGEGGREEEESSDGGGEEARETDREEGEERRGEARAGTREGGREGGKGGRRRRPGQGPGGGQPGTRTDCTLVRSGAVALLACCMQHALQAAGRQAGQAGARVCVCVCV